MKIEELNNIEFKGWYIEEISDNKVTLRSDYTEDALAEIYIAIEGKKNVIVSYFSQKGEGVFFKIENNISTNELAEKVIESADSFFDYI